MWGGGACPPVCHRQVPAGRLCTPAPCLHRTPPASTDRVLLARAAAQPRGVEELNAFDLINMRGGTAIVRMLETGGEGASTAAGRGRTTQYLCRGEGGDALHAIVDAIAMVR